MDHERLTADDVKRLEELQRKRKAAVLADPVQYFPWSPSQTFIMTHAGELERPVRILLLLGGNQSGKSVTGKAIVGEVQRRRGPIAAQIRSMDNITHESKPIDGETPLRIWVMAPTLKKYRSDWVNPPDGMGVRYWLAGAVCHRVKAPDDIHYAVPPAYRGREAELKIDKRTWDEGRLDHIVGFSQDADIHTFEMSACHLAVVDEEWDSYEKFTSVMRRMSVTNGVIVLPFTPLMGLSWPYEIWWKPYVLEGRARPVHFPKHMLKTEDPRVRKLERIEARRGLPYCHVYEPEEPTLPATLIARLPMWHNPNSVDHALETLADPTLTDAAKDARVRGLFGYVEGALIQALAGIDIHRPLDDHKVYVVDRLPGDGEMREDGTRAPSLTRPVIWRLVADPNKSYGALLACLDSDDNVFLVSEHLEFAWPTTEHVKVLKNMMKHYATTGRKEYYADPGASGAQAIVDLRAEGLHFRNVPRGQHSVARSIKKIRALAHVDPEHRHPITGEMGAPRLFFYRPGIVSEKIIDGIPVKRARIADQISCARQKKDGKPDEPDKDAKNRLDLWDCLRYHADLAPAPALRKRKELRPHNPDVLRFRNNRPVREHAHAGFETPNYDWSGRGLW